MIECKDILALCDQFEAYLMPLDIAILRLRYNGKQFKSTIKVAKEMGISAETVRAIENRSLDYLADCVDLEEAGQPITAMRLTKAFKQPVASLICQSLWCSASCAAYTAHRGHGP
jgi:Sigma-70, region 4